ncbi:hypothetical protein [Methylocystis parvus]|uniref:hypothetical protein n=1 Tax=Methylocystis parvus TaxID=134 RepID=UPI003C74562C
MASDSIDPTTIKLAELLKIDCLFDELELARAACREMGIDQDRFRQRENELIEQVAKLEAREQELMKENSALKREVEIGRSDVAFARYDAIAEVLNILLDYRIDGSPSAPYDIGCRDGQEYALEVLTRQIEAIPRPL